MMENFYRRTMRLIDLKIAKALGLKSRLQSADLPLCFPAPD
jgi:hypothetical protein